MQIYHRMKEPVSHIPTSSVSKESLSCIIIDDEPIALRGMALMADRHPALDLKAMFSTPQEALKWMEDQSPDLVFLDIEMPGIKGIDLATRFPSQTMVIFTTAYSEYAAFSYELDAVDYLLKPFDSARFDRAVQKALLRNAARSQQRPADPSTTLTLRADRRFLNINTDKIIYIEGVKDYVKIHTDSERIFSRITIKSLLERLPSERFLRIHKSYIINILHVKAHDNSKVILRSASGDAPTIELPVGASFRPAILKLHSHIHNSGAPI